MVQSSKKDSGQVYRKLVKISKNYFGPATERFLTAQITNHLHKLPNELTRQDIPDLIDWLRLALSVVSNDTPSITAYIDDVKKLGLLKIDD